MNAILKENPADDRHKLPHKNMLRAGAGAIQKPASTPFWDLKTRPCPSAKVNVTEVEVALSD